MRVALYENCEQLPQWGSKLMHLRLFEPEKFQEWTYEDINEDGKEKIVGPISEYRMMPLLMGLHQLDIPGVMAHVSLHVNEHAKKVSSPFETSDRYGYIWVRITTDPGSTNEKLAILWGNDNDYYYFNHESTRRRAQTPFDLLEHSSAGMTAPLWGEFFRAKLTLAKLETHARLVSMEKQFKNFLPKETNKTVLCSLCGSPLDHEIYGICNQCTTKIVSLGPDAIYRAFLYKAIPDAFHYATIGELLSIFFNVRESHPLSDFLGVIFRSASESISALRKIKDKEVLQTKLKEQLEKTENELKALHNKYDPLHEKLRKSAYDFEE